jgi:hypothetical protein
VFSGYQAAKFPRNDSSLSCTAKSLQQADFDVIVVKHSPTVYDLRKTTGAGDFLDSIL